jgi:hypothetical protein
MKYEKSLFDMFYIELLIEKRMNDLSKCKKELKYSAIDPPYRQVCNQMAS